MHMLEIIIVDSSVIPKDLKANKGSTTDGDNEKKQQETTKGSGMGNDSINQETNTLMMAEIDSYFENKNKKRVNNEAIESTMRFKYIRSLEALFESTPHSVLQLVYLMRTGDFLHDYVIVISTVQSIISMTNSMLAADNAYMSRAKFKKYKKRLPPSKQFLKRGLVGLSEISYRVGIFAIFWTVVGGEWFGVLLGYELLLAIILNLLIWFHSTVQWQDVFLSLNIVCYLLLRDFFLFSFLFVALCGLSIYLSLCNIHMTRF